MIADAARVGARAHGAGEIDMADGPEASVATAAINWFDSQGGLHIRVYSSDGNNVTERCSDAGGSGWTTGAFAQPGIAVSATVWTVNGAPSIRVYVTQFGTTTEWCSDPNQTWHQGSYSTASSS
jgi:hypothetical protein